MSWNKNTIRASNLRYTASLIKESGGKCKLTKLGTFDGEGLNDDYLKSEDFELYRLELGDGKILQEYVQRTHDCDSDDTVICSSFKPHQNLNKMHKEIWVDCEDFDCPEPNHPIFWQDLNLEIKRNR